MKQYIYIYLLFLCAVVQAQIQVLSSNRKVNDMVYSPVSNKIYAIVSDNEQQYPKALLLINPLNNLVETSFDLGSKPKRMAISDDYKYIYIGFSDSPIVTRFVTDLLVFDQEFNLGFDQDDNPFYANDIVVKPGEPNTIIISRYIQNNTVPNDRGIALFKNGVQGTNDYGDQDFDESVQKIKFLNSGTLIGHAPSLSTTPITKFNVTTNGVMLNGIYENILTPMTFSSASYFIIHNSKAYFTNGLAVDLNTTTPTLIGQSQPVIKGGVVYNPEDNLIYHVYANNLYIGGVNLFLRRYNPITLELYDEMPLDAAGGYVSNIIKCGENCFAINCFDHDADNKISQNFTILRNIPLNVESKNPETINIYPNPSTDFIFIDTNDTFDIKNIDIYDLKGYLVLQIKNINNSVDIHSLPQGLYLLRLTTENDNIYTKKIIKI